MVANLDNKVIFLDVPLTVGQVVNSSVNDFSYLMSVNNLTPQQVAHCKLLRRRGLNKLAARRVRRRHLDEMIELRERLSQSLAVGVALNLLNEEKLKEKREIYREIEDLIGESLHKRQLDPRIYGIEVVDGRCQFIELWSQREVTEDELREMQL